MTRLLQFPRYHATIKFLTFLLAMLALLVIFGGGEFAHAQSAVSMTGLFTITMGDSGPGANLPHQQIYRLVDDQGQDTELVLDEKLAEPHGGVFGLRNMRVHVLAIPTPVGPNDKAHSKRKATVQNITPVSAPTGPSGAPAPSAVTGAVKWINILCKFSDSPGVEPRTQSYFTGLFSNSYPGLNDFWSNNSYGQVNLTADNSPASGSWYTLPNPRSYYLPGGNLNFSAAAADCTSKANASVYFPNYFGINLMFNDDLDGYAWGGTQTISADGGGTYAMTWEPPWGYENAGPITHEIGHGFGLPHSNNSDGDTNPYDSVWDVMSDMWTNCVYHATYNCVERGTIGYHRDRLGWIPAGQIYAPSGSAPQTITIDALDVQSIPAGEYRMAQITISSSQFYTVEVRRPQSYDSSLPGSAVIIHQVQPSRGEPAWVIGPWNGDSVTTVGAMFTPGEGYTLPNGTAVTVVAATANGYQVTIAPSTGDPPANDSFNAPIVISMPYTTWQDTTNATTAGDDPFMSCYGNKHYHSVWYDWTAPSDGTLITFNTIGSDYDTVLAMWTGSQGALSSVACDDDGGIETTSYLSDLPVTSGTTYHFEIAGFASGDSGTLGISADFTPVGGDPYELNDTPATATVIADGAVLTTTTIDPVDDVDYFRFAGSSGDEVIVDIDAVVIESYLWPEIYLYGSDGTTLLASDPYDGDDAYLAYTLPSTGNFYIEIRDQDWPDYGGPDSYYELRLTITANSPPTTPSNPGPAADATVERTTDLSFTWDTISAADCYVTLVGGPDININSGWASCASWDVGEQWPGAYTWQVQARNAIGTTTGPLWNLYIKPYAPSSLTATPASQTQIDLSWTQSSDDPGSVDSYDIYQDSAFVANVAAGTTSYPVTGLTCATTYAFEVKAKRQGVLSNAASAGATTVVCNPDAPTLLTATANGQLQVDLAWADNASNETGFKVERSLATIGDWTLIDTTAADATTYSDTTASCNTAYDYRVTATNAGGDSSPSNTATDTTDACAPILSLSATSHDFGNQVLTIASSPFTFTVTNTGAANLNVGTLALTGSTNFALTANTCDGQAILPGADCSFDVTLTPTSLGALAASVSVPNDASGNPHSVSLSGTGTQPAVSLSDTSHDFGNQVVSATSSGFTVTVTNSGTADLNIGTLGITGDFALANDNCTSQTVAASGTCAFDVTFTPTSLGAKSGSVSIPNDAPGNPHSVSLSGMGIPPNLLVNGGMELDVNADKIPDNWKKSTTIVAKTDKRDCLTLAHGGLCSFTMKGNGNTKKLSQSKTITLANGTPFTFSVWVKTSGVPAAGKYAQVKLIYTDLTTKVVKFLIPLGTNDWTPYTVSFSATKKVKSFTVTLMYNPGGGFIWFDDVSLTTP